MCGICGYIGFEELQERREAVLTDMMDRIVHRGPDSAGSYVDEQAAIGFRRLSIIDISASGDQPLYNEDRTKVLTFNGEIYNYRELRDELLAAGHVFCTQTDSETILHGYEQWGESVVEHLRGMYSFVIWDREEKSLFGAVDMFSIKPLYYFKSAQGFLYGSEIKSFLPHPGFVKKFNEDVLGYYLTFQFVPTDETFFKGVFRLPPGHSFLYKNGELTLKRYFEPFRSEASGECASSDDELFRDDTVLADAVEAVMKETVAAHKISDVEVASYLSSGVDSGYLTCLSEVDHTFTVGFSDKRYSEIDHAKQLADRIGVTNHSHVISKEEYWEKLPDIQYYMDEPVADPAAIALYFLSREARKHVKVVLSGEGSDELFGGYNIYREPLEYTGFNRVPFAIRRLLGRLAEALLPYGTKGRSFLIRHGKTLEERYFTNATTVFSEREAARVLACGKRPDVTKITAPLYARVKDRDSVTKMQYIDMHLWLAHDILVKGDKMGMANSVEVRVPFLDKNVMAFCEKLPLGCKIRSPQTKVALRMAAHRRMSNEMAERKKLGFPVPVREWLRQEDCRQRVLAMFDTPAAAQFFDTIYLKRLMEEHRAGKADYSRKIWCVYIFLVWYHRFFVEM